MVKKIGLCFELDLKGPKMMMMKMMMMMMMMMVMMMMMMMMIMMMVMMKMVMMKMMMMVIMMVIMIIMIQQEWIQTTNRNGKSFDWLGPTANSDRKVQPVKFAISKNCRQIRTKGRE